MRARALVPVVIATVAVSVGWVANAQAGVYPTNICVSKKLNAAARQCIGVLAAWSSWEKHQKTEKRDVLCPVCLDDAWKDKAITRHDPLWRQVAKKNVLKFPRRRGKEFDDQFRKLFNGLKMWYAPKGEADSPGASADQT